MSWKKLESTTVYENPWMRVYEDRVINPGGGENRYGWVHFRNRAVAIVALDDRDHTWLVGQDRYPLGEYSWELPMGGAPLAEAPLAAAQRELREETGLTARRWREVMHLHTSNSITDEAGIVFLAEDLAEGPSASEESEVLAIRRLPLAAAVAMCLDGRISDAISVAALLRIGGGKTSAP